jgi:thiazole synthase
MTTQDSFIIAGKSYNSRLLVGSGKYTDLTQTFDATMASGANIITVAIRRVNIGQNSKQENLLDVISPKKFTILPNTAGCYTAKDAVRTCKLARELLDGKNLVKLEVLGDDKTLYPNIVETLVAAKELVNDNFEVMVYTNDDPIVAKELENIGCVAIMPLASLIGSGQGINNTSHIKIIKQNAKVPVLIDAGIGCASDAAKAMELGCDGVLMNSAIANAKNPVLMAKAMKHAIIAGRQSFLAGRMAKKNHALASSPLNNLI